jgi:epoxyqueuosine reductase
MPPESLTARLKAEAGRLGFHHVGVTTPQPPASIGVYESWLAEGYHGEMTYLETERAHQCRADLRKILPECQSILVLGIHYFPENTQALEPGLGKIAAYALNEDYHETLAPRLAALVAFLEREVEREVPNRWYTDTGPILERELAQRAGLGWIGKNSMLIHPKAGSYFLLSEILLGIPLKPDAPFTADYCGSCTRCIDACPTACITPHRTLDVRRCLSYLTIEHKGSTPDALRSLQGNWVFGCDICQQVCPWNLRFAPPVSDPAFAPPPELLPLNLIRELSLSPAEFNRKFNHSPVKRAKRRGYLRNVAVALGNAKEQKAVKALAKTLLEEGEPLVRGHAAWALGQIGGEESRAALYQGLAQEKDTEVRREIEAQLKNWSSRD